MERNSLVALSPGCLFVILEQLTAYRREIEAREGDHQAELAGINADRMTVRSILRDKTGLPFENDR